MPVSSLIYTAAGSPLMNTTHVGTCRLCRTDTNGMPFDSWVKPTFTNFDLLCQGTIICSACQFCTTEQTPTLQERVNKDKPQKFRNYSHFVVDGIWYPLSKAQKTTMIDLLMQSPQVAIIADSGQKHLFFRATVGWWQFEEQSLRPNPSLLRELLDIIHVLMDYGFSKTAIEKGVYPSYLLMQHGIETIMEYESQITLHRGSPLFKLAIFLA